jgi:hypothetical protein
MLTEGAGVGSVAKACPFNSAAYAFSLPHLGTPDPRAGSPAVLLRRTVPGNARHDGLAPWPYLWLESHRQIDALSEAYRDFVTITAVTQPGFHPPAVFPSGDAVAMKDHFVYDPGLAFSGISKKARYHLRKAESTWSFEIVSDFGERLALAGLYDELKRRRGLDGGYFDFPPVHFEALARLPDAVYFRVRDGEGVGGMVCAVVFGDWIQVLHIALSDRGLGLGASYLLMHEILRIAETDGRLVLTGGMPRRGEPGLERFKRRWSNCLRPVFLLRIVNDRSAYARLAKGSESNAFFPAYRRCDP